MSRGLLVGKFLFTPYVILIITHCISFSMWLFPSFGFLRKGFEEHADIFSFSGFLALFYIFFLVLMSWVFYRLGNTFNLVRGDGVAMPKMFLNVTLVLSFAGVFALLIKVFSLGGSSFIWEVLSGGQANQLKYLLYEGYSFGVLTFRYFVVIAAAVATLMLVEKRAGYLVFSLALILLLVVSLVSSRLTLVMSFFIFLYLYVSKKGHIYLSYRQMVLGGVGGFLLLSILNYSRNYGYYEVIGQGFFAAGFSEIMTYLGTPFQGLLAAISQPYQDAAVNHNAYSTIEYSLTTNSSLLEVIAKIGEWGVLYSFFFVCLMSFFSGILSTSNSLPLMVSNGVILYGFAEYWRLFFFDKGIFLVLFLLPILFTIVNSLRNATWRKTF